VACFVVHVPWRSIVNENGVRLGLEVWASVLVRSVAASFGWSLLKESKRCPR